MLKKRFFAWNVMNEKSFVTCFIWLSFSVDVKEQRSYFKINLTEWFTIISDTHTKQLSKSMGRKQFSKKQARHSTLIVIRRWYHKAAIYLVILFIKKSNLTLSINEYIYTSNLVSEWKNIQNFVIICGNLKFWVVPNKIRIIMLVNLGLKCLLATTKTKYFSERKMSIAVVFFYWIMYCLQ